MSLNDVNLWFSGRHITSWQLILVGGLKQSKKNNTNPPTLPSSSQGRAAPGTTFGVELCLQHHPLQRPLKL